RGIGRVTSNLVAAARTAVPELARARFLALIDPAMPPLAPSHRALFESERSAAQPALLRRPAWFVEPSPMTHDPLFVAPLLAEPALFSAAVVHDFIPYDAPEHYLSRPGARLAYATALAWLGRYRLFLPNSATTAARLATLLNVAERDIAVAGAPLDPLFLTSSASALRRHVLVAGGADRRKNVECPLRAHAAAPRFARVPIIVSGIYSPADIERLSALHADEGGEPSLLSFAGAIDDAELLRLYREALAVVVPSRAEGFSLPVIEAMAQGSPVLASAIPVHAELITDPAFLFPPDDPRALARLVERVLSDPSFAASLIAAGRTAWPRFRAERVAERFWQAVAARATPQRPATPAIARARRPRVALLTPLPPDCSGVADYSAASVPELGRRVELHLFTATPSPAVPPGAASVRPLSALPFLSRRFDRVIGVLGNSQYHVGIFHLLLRYGGAAIAHDARMLGFYRGVLGIEHARAVAQAELGRAVAPEEIERWLADEAELPTLFLGELAAGCTPLIFHSALTARLAAQRYRIAPHWLPFSLQRPWRTEALRPAARAAARARLGLGDDEVVLASFGYVHSSKCSEECIWALAMLRGWGIAASLVFVGAVHGDGAALRALARRLDIADRVRFLDSYIGEAGYRDWLLAADLAIQLRRFGFGSISGTLSDCIAAAVPTIANAELAETMAVPSFVATIPDPVSPVLLANA
ncbi:MAG: glycosyltransferase, partial [Acetobacteraceae bacterium]